MERHIPRWTRLEELNQVPLQVPNENLAGLDVLLIVVAFISRMSSLTLTFIWVFLLLLLDWAVNKVLLGGYQAAAMSYVAD